MEHRRVWEREECRGGEVVHDELDGFVVWELDLPKVAAICPEY
jgi:hypothetical protein